MNSKSVLNYLKWKIHERLIHRKVTQTSEIEVGHKKTNKMLERLNNRKKLKNEDQQIKSTNEELSKLSMKVSKGGAGKYFNKGQEGIQDEVNKRDIVIIVEIKIIDQTNVQKNNSKNRTKIELQEMDVSTVVVEDIFLEIVRVIDPIIQIIVEVAVVGVIIK